MTLGDHKACKWEIKNLELATLSKHIMRCVLSNFGEVQTKIQFFMNVWSLSSDIFLLYRENHPQSFETQGP